MKFGSWPAFLFLAAASCSGGQSAQLYEGQMEEVIDPGSKALRDEIATFPFRQIVWEYKLTAKEISRITLGDDYLYIETSDNRLLAMDRFSAEVKWSYQIETGAPLDWPPVEAYKVTGEIRREEAARQEWARRVDDIVKEKGPGKESQEAQKRRDEAAERLRQAQMGDNLYFISRGMMFCLVRMTGAVIWTKPLTREFVPSAQPFAVRTHVFVASSNVSRVWALEAGTGKTLASFPTSMGAHDKSITNQPKYEDPALYFVSHDGNVYGYHMATDAHWTFPTDGELRADPVVYNYTEPAPARKEGEGNPPASRTTRFLFVGGFDHTFYALDGAGGNVIWRYETAGVMKTPAIAKDSTVYVKTEEGALFALDVNPQMKDKKGNVLGPKRSGVLRWKLPLGERFLVKGQIFVYVMGPNDEIYKMNEMTGEIAGRYPVRIFPFILSNTMDSIVYVAHPSGYIYALREPKE